MNAEELRSRVHESAGYERLLAPNEYAAIGFDNFVLFTRVTKQIGLRLCSVARPTDQEIAEMLSATEDHRRSLNRLVRRFRGEPERLKNALATLLRSTFSLETHESEPIIGLILGR